MKQYRIVKRGNKFYPEYYFGNIHWQAIGNFLGNEISFYSIESAKEYLKKITDKNESEQAAKEKQEVVYQYSAKKSNSTTENEATRLFNIDLNGIYPQGIDVCGNKYQASELLKAIDPTAYSWEFSCWLKAENIEGKQ